jgi:hypothetical protein
VTRTVKPVVDLDIRRSRQVERRPPKQCVRTRNPIMRSESVATLGAMSNLLAVLIGAVTRSCAAIDFIGATGDVRERLI